MPIKIAEDGTVILRNLAITRETVDALLDRGRIEIAMATRGQPNGKWWKIRRNGATKRWKRDASRIYVPYKAGMYVYGQITEGDFLENGELNPAYFRLIPNVEE